MPHHSAVPAYAVGGNPQQLYSLFFTAGMSRLISVEALGGHSFCDTFWKRWQPSRGCPIAFCAWLPILAVPIRQNEPKFVIDDLLLGRPTSVTPPRSPTGSLRAQEPSLTRLRQSYRETNARISPKKR